MSVEPMLTDDLMRRVERLVLQARARISGTMQGKRRSVRLGGSMEFADYRPYAPGDDLRRLDWHVYARTGKPYIKQYLDEQEVDIYLYVDVTASMGFPAGKCETGREGIGQRSGWTKLDVACRLAACVGYAALCSYDRVSINLFGERLSARLSPLRGKGSAFRMFDFLQHVAMEPRGDLAGVFMNSASLPARPGISFVFSDFLFAHGVEDSLKALRAARQEVVAVQILSPEELTPNLSGDLRLIDSETNTGKEVAISMSVLKAYERSVHRLTRHLERFCFEQGIVHQLAVTSVPVEDMVLREFRRKGIFH